MKKESQDEFIKNEIPLFTIKELNEALKMAEDSIKYTTDLLENCDRVNEASIIKNTVFSFEQTFKAFLKLEG